MSILLLQIYEPLLYRVNQPQKVLNTDALVIAVDFCVENWVLRMTAASSIKSY